jgi:nucleotide-binding universal stress UspA family protein
MKILLAVDGTEFSQAATQTLASQLRPEGVEVLVLCVVEPHIFSIPPQMAEGYAPEQEAVLKEELQHARESVNQASKVLCSAGFNLKTRVVEAEARNGILDVAEEWRADLIVLGSHGRKGLRRFLLGSVAEFVARHARCSICIVRIPSER